MKEKLMRFLKDGKDWERKLTNISGVFVLKIPKFKTTSESLAIEINPVNQVTGAITKKRGIVIRSTSELTEISNIITNPKLQELASKIDVVNPTKTKTVITRDDSDIIEI